MSDETPAPSSPVAGSGRPASDADRLREAADCGPQRFIPSPDADDPPLSLEELRYECETTDEDERSPLSSRETVAILNALDAALAAAVSPEDGLRALSENWRVKAESYVTSRDAEMIAQGVVWIACADELDALLAAATTVPCLGDER